MALTAQVMAVLLSFPCQLEALADGHHQGLPALPWLPALSHGDGHYPTWEGWRRGWHGAEHPRRGILGLRDAHEVQNQAETFYSKQGTDLLL